MDKDTYRIFEFVANPLKLTTTFNKIATVPNPVNVDIIEEFYQYMKSKRSEHHQNNTLKVVIAFAKFLGPDTVSI